MSLRTLRRSGPESSINGSIPTAYWSACKSIRKVKPRFAGLLQSPLPDSNRRPPLYEEGPCVNCVGCLYRPVRAGAVVVGGELGSSLYRLLEGEDKADWSSLRWRSSLRTVRRPGGRWRLWERRVRRG